MKECTASGCGSEARWESDGKLLCACHAMEHAISRRRPAQLLPPDRDDQAEPAAVSVWDELTSAWESMSIDDHEAVEQLVVCLLEQGKQQEMELLRMRGA